MLIPGLCVSPPIPLGLHKGPVKEGFGHCFPGETPLQAPVCSALVEEWPGSPGVMPADLKLRQEQATFQRVVVCRGLLPGWVVGFPLHLFSWVCPLGVPMSLCLFS